MNKNICETYEFLPDDSGDNQILVVQENGTYLINRPIQYLTQVQDIKAVLEEDQTSVYNENSEQFYVNTDNTEELVSDEYVVSNAENNVLTNGYFLQPFANLKEEQIEQEEGENIIEYKEVPVENTDANADSRVTESCTEITISDEQYQLLEQKGWILLVINDKKYLLDNTGLHDITNNEKLVENLRNDMETCDPEGQETSSLEQNEDDTCENQDEQVHYVVTDDMMEAEENDQEISSSYLKIENDDPEVEMITNTGNKKNILTLSQPDNRNAVKRLSPAKPIHKPIRIKTKHLFKDIPPEIVLGRTVNGKKLVARVVKNDKPLNEIDTSRPMNDANTGLSEVKFESLIRYTLNGNSRKCTTRDITAAETVVEQLLRVPAFRPAVMERQLVVTKIVLHENEAGTAFRESTPTLVCGRVTCDAAEPRFTHVPDLLDKLLKDEEENLLRRKDIHEGSFLHIHIREMKGVNGIVRISITLIKRNLPIRLVSELKIRQPTTVFACSACASVFDTEHDLKQHQEGECALADESLVIVTENTKDDYTVINMGKEKQYVCNQCQSRFSKLNNCQKHVKTHYTQNIESDSIEDENNGSQAKEGKVFKCKMCPSTYLHVASLSKHIVSKHIKIRSK